MTFDQAVAILDEAAAQISTNRQNHIAYQQAVETIRRTYQELQQSPGGKAKGKERV